MARNSFTQELAKGGILLLDGAMGTMLQASGLPAGVSPEKFCLENPDILRGIHKAYLDAGSNIITTCTFGGNAYKMPKDMDVFSFNKTMAAIAVEAASQARAASRRPVFVAGNIGPSGLFTRPLGDLEPGDLIGAFEVQARGLAAGGVDLIFIETQFDLAEARAAAVAARRACGLPVMVSMTFEHGVSLTGSTPEVFAETMLNLGVAAVGSNCSLGPDEMRPVVEALAACSDTVMAEPNAGMPRLVDGRTEFPLGPDEFAARTAAFIKLGVRILGGCCGTTPAHVRALARAAAAMERPESATPGRAGICLTSRSAITRIGHGSPLALIGERINPTGKPKLAAQLRDGVFSEALRLADEQIECGAAVLDVNVGAPLVDEARVLPALACALISRHAAPLSLDSPDGAAIAAALPFCPGSFLVNSISGEGERMDVLGPLCRDFGSPFILLPLRGAELPVRAAERIAIVEKLLEKAEALDIPRRLIMIDILALAASSSADAAGECLLMAAWCAREGFATTIGLSNVSFGLPARELLNATFLGMARGAGLASCIANPGAGRLREAVAAMNALEGHDAGAQSFIDVYARWKNGAAGAGAGNGHKARAGNLYEAVLLGDRETMPELLEKELALGANPFAIVNEMLIPAITEVGSRYERREYFLPQLIRSAETMQAAVAILKPLMEEARGPEKRPVIVMATVEGDIHDIGKNIVSLLLGNHGFEVVDAGKNVPAAEIVACAERNNAGIIGLSALMTTTMARMEDTIRLVKERGLPIKVMVGGAAVTQAFADAIGADAYCDDAVASVKAAKSFLAP